MKSLSCVFFALLTSSLLVSSPAALADVDCTNQSLTSLMVHEMPAEGYWMQPVDNCRMTHTGVGGINGKLYNYCAGKYESITNGMDPFPLPGGDGNLYIHPGGPKGMSFYKFSEAQKKNGANEPFYGDIDLPGVYQSVGLVSENGNKRRIRIAVGWQAGWYRDYDVVQEGADYKITPITKARDVCKNIPTGGLDSELPILSRNGRFIAGRDYGTRTTRVYRIDPDYGRCALISTIPSETSKVSFNFENNRLAFKVVDPLTRKGRLMDMDFKTGAFRTLTGPDEDVRYMTYRPDGKLLYSRARSGAGHGYDQKSELVMLSAEALANVDPARSSDAEAVGQLWANACGKQLDTDTLRAVGSRMDPKNCKELVTEQRLAKVQWKAGGPKDLESLLKFCLGNQTGKMASPAQ